VTTPPFEEIVVGFDGTERGHDALRLGELLAGTTGASLRVVRVFERAGREEAASLSAEVDAVLGESVVEAEPLPLAGGSPARALHELAATRPGVGLIVLGSTHRAGFGRVLPGSVARRLLHGAPCAIAVAPRGYVADELRVIEVCYDASAEAEAALETAAMLGRLARATLRVIAVDAPPTGAAVSTPGAPGAARVPAAVDLQAELHARVSRLPANLRALPVFERGDPARVLLARAEEGVDLMVVGSRGYGPLGVALLGSVSVAVIENATCPVLVTPRHRVDQR
jgi:nucleotide-binding universal stress UspA family protein